MKIAFFHAAIVAAAVNAAEPDFLVQTSNIYDSLPDMLVQTANMMEYFFA